jgi:hypothetical protein
VLRKRLVVTFGLAAAVGLASAGPSTAHQTCISIPSRATACNRDAVAGDLPHEDHWVDACDRDADGLRTRAWFSVKNVAGDDQTDWDPNGADPGCAHKRTFIFHLTRHRSCVEVVGCTAWENH